MSELTDVLSAIESLSARGRKLALATIVAVSGSTYRRPGARLLVPEEGELVGNISGGCLENDVADVAKIVMREGVARIVPFTSPRDDAVWGWGLGCGAFELFVDRRQAAGGRRTAWPSRRSDRSRW
jgi:xanthine/CO dehydrogenase XdhC/CoxF family maturation factor